MIRNSSLPYLVSFAKKLLVIVLIIIALLGVDVSLNSATAVTSIAVSWGIATFIAIAVAFGIGQYFILEMVKRKSTVIRVKSVYLRSLNTLVTITQYVLTVILGLLVLQILLTSHYYTAILNCSSTITYALAAFVMGILTLKFFLWYNTNRRNFVVLQYGISTMAVSINMIIYLVFVSGTLSGMSAERNPQSQAPMILFPSNTTMGTVQSMWSISFLVSFILLWTSTVILLHHYSQSLGRLRFWTLLIIPLAAQISIYAVIVPLVNQQQIPELSSISISKIDKLYVNILGYSLPGIAAGIVFGIPFWTVARNIRHGMVIRDYLVIAGIGLVLFEMSTAPAEGVATAPYPPFGLASVLFAGLACYLILIGLYYSAVSISENSNLRKSIREYALKETKMLDSIGTANMEIEIQRRVMRITKAQANTMAEESGIETAISDDEMRLYLQQVLDEIKNSKEE
jgi:hypothetical protein